MMSTILNKLITFDFLLVNFVDEIKSDILKTFCKFNSMSARVFCLSVPLQVEVFGRFVFKFWSK